MFCTVTERTWFDCISLLVMPCITIMWQIKKPWPWPWTLNWKSIFLHNVDYSRTSCALTFSMKLCYMDSSTRLICLLTLLCSHRDGNVSPHAALDHPGAGTLYLLHAGHGLLLPQWSWGSTAPYEGSNRRHLGGHHRSQRVRISPVHLWSSQITQVIFWKCVKRIILYFT